MKKTIVAFLLCSSLAMLSADSIGNIAEAKSNANFQPGVESVIQNTYLQHKAELPNPNETPDVLKQYLSLKNSPNELSGFKSLVQKYPDSKHAHNGLAMSYYNEFRATKNQRDAALALQEEIAAAKISYSYGELLFASWIRQMAIDADQVDLATQWFDEVLAKDPNQYEVNLNYAEIVKNTDQIKTEKLLKNARDSRPTGNIDAHVAFTEFLLENDRTNEALNNSILVGENAYYLDFLHGYALEKAGRGAEAMKYYKRFAPMSKSFPASEKYKIPNSNFQAESGVVFGIGAGDGGSGGQSLAQYNLSYVTACEAGGETIGGMRQVAWSVRQRVNRGTIQSCLYVDNSGSNMDDKYAHVVCQSNQYTSITCSSGSVSSCTNVQKKSATSDQVAYDVYNGSVPDPFTNFCPSGNSVGNNSCTASCSSSGNATAYQNTTPHSFLSYSHTPPSCMKSAGAVCGNGSPDNYFDYNN